MWEKREREWEAERLARKKLMDEVIAVQEKQVSHQNQLNVSYYILIKPIITTLIKIKQIELKLLTAQREREQLLEEREEIIQSLDSYRKKMEAKKMDYQAKQSQNKDDLLTQMNDKKRREEELNRMEQRERERREIMEERYNEKHWNLAMDKLKL